MTALLLRAHGQQRLDYVNQTHLVQASGKPVLQKIVQLIKQTHGSTVGAGNVGADLLHGLVEVVLPHGVALSRQLRTGPAVHVVRVVAVVAAAVALAFPIILDVL